MDVKQSKELTNDVLIADALVRIKAIENLLISKGLFSEDELKDQIKSVVELLALTILQKSNISGDLNKIIKGLQ